MAEEGVGIQLSLKILFNNRGKRVLFAEAGKDFVDFLFHIMTLPVGTVIRLLQDKGMAGCVGNVYRSIQNISDVYMESTDDKEALLKPKSPSCGASFSLLLSDYSPSTCNSSPSACKKQQGQMNSGTSRSSGYVKEVVTYMVMDDLVVKPMSTISIIAMLNRFDVKDLGALEEKVIAVRMNEALEILRTSLYSKNVLTDVFFGKN